jgi:ABC-type nickel/cobalt efflux system permease component RcnA
MQHEPNDQPQFGASLSRNRRCVSNTFFDKSIVVIGLLPFSIAAFILFFATALKPVTDLAFSFGLALACPKANAIKVNDRTLVARRHPADANE